MTDRRSTRLTLLALCVTLLSSALATPARGQQDATQRREVLWYEAPALVPTRILLPDDFDASAPHSAVIAMHGYGSSAEAFERVGETLRSAGFIVAVPQAPYAMLIEDRLGFDWTLHHVDDDELSNRATLPLMLQYLPTIARDLAARYRIDRLYTLGFSQGAVMALGTAIFNPELFDGLVSFGLPDFSPAWISPDALAAGTDVDILLVHGRADEIAPFAASEAARDFFVAAGYDVTLRPFAGEHAVPDAQLETAARWMRQDRDDR